MLDITHDFIMCKGAMQSTVEGCVIGSRTSKFLIVCSIDFNCSSSDTVYGDLEVDKNAQTGVNTKMQDLYWSV